MRKMTRAEAVALANVMHADTIEKRNKLIKDNPNNRRDETIIRAARDSRGRQRGRDGDRL